jgi:hypothetical protein
MPKTTDIVNRIITFKDLYGSSSNSTITLVTRSGDTFEDGTFSTIISNAYQTINFYAGQPGKWLNIDGGSGGSSAGLTTVSNNLTTVSNSVVANMGSLTTVSNSGVTNTTNLTTVSNSVVANMGYLTTVSNSGVTNTTNLTTVSNSVVANMGYLTTVSNSGVTNTTNLTTVSNTVAAGRFAYVSTNTVSTNLIIAGYVSSPQGYISSLVVDALSFSLSNSFISMGDIITTSVSTIQTFTSTLTTNNLKVGTVSSLSYIAFSGLQQGYTQSVVAEQATASGVQELLIFRGSTNTDRIRMQTTGPIVFEPGVSARVFPATGSNATPAMIITTGSNVGIGVAAPTVSLDVAGAGRFTAVSTNTISTGTLNAGYVITSLPQNTSAASVSPLAITNGNAYLSFSPQIEFQYNTGGFKHFMGSRHNGSATNSFGNAIDFWLYSATGGAGASTTPGTCNVNTMSVTAAGVGIFNNSPSLALDVAGAGRFTAVSTTSISTNTLTVSNINGTGDLPIQAAAGCNVNLTALYINLIANNVQFSSNFAMNTGTTAATYNLTAANFTRTVSLSTNTISTSTLTVGGSALSARLGIQSNATTLTSPASVIITIPNMSYFFADYTNLTNYITISNYGAQNGDYINIVNTGNSGTPATFQILDGSTGVSTNIRYIYPGHAGVVAYSGSQWWPM